MSESVDLNVLLEEEEDDDFLLLYHLFNCEREPTDPIFKSRKEEGSYVTLIKRHLESNEIRFRQYCRINKKQFNFVLSLIYYDILPKQRGAISPEEKLFLTLRFIATGESYESLSLQYRISENYICRIIKQVLKLLRQKLPPLVMPTPNREDFKKIESEFWNRWNMPNCIGSIDGKHIRMRAPHNSGSLYFNYKEYFSIVLLAVVDANYKFVAIDAGSYGKEGDSGIFRKSTMRRCIANNNFNIPPPKPLPGTSEALPHYLVGDEAFPLSSFLMKPYSRRSARLNREMEIYNYRLSRARRVVENAFGILSQVFRIFYTPIAVKPETCTDITVTACCLHNILRDAYLEDNGRPYFTYDPAQRPTQNMTSLVRPRDFGDYSGIYVRDKLKDFFCSNYGAVSWQENMVNRLE